MQLTFLKALVPLTKTYTRKAGELTKTPYPMLWEFSSEVENVNTLEQLAVTLQAHAAKGHCLLKGQLTKPLVNESRAGSTDPNGTTEFVVLDLDGLNAPTIQDFLDAVGFSDVSYVLQWSASFGIENHDLRAHVFFILDQIKTAPLLKQWLMQLNHDTSLLRDAMSLTKTGNMISWPLDISACQNDKLIYIASPNLKGIKDPMPSNRISVVKKKYLKLMLPKLINSAAKNKELTHKRLEELRDAAGLAKHKPKYKVIGSTEVMLSPDACTITDTKTERGFVYFNINGGDSWAYYHPENKPDYIYNFKGEPAYLTKELLPDYWEELNTTVATRAGSSGITYLAFLDRATSIYWRGTYDKGNDLLDLAIAKTETQLRHFCKQHGVLLGDFVPEWSLVFNPHDSVRVDFDTRIVNAFQQTTFMRNASTKPVTSPPKTIARIIAHVLGGDQALINHWYNWLAVIAQYMDMTKTAWVMHGRTGTGKGILFDRVLRILFGMDNTTARRQEELDEKFNAYMENKLLIFIDEVETKALSNEKGVIAKTKNLITERIVPLRKMHATGVEARNYSNWIFASNKADPILIEENDRRFNVGKYQPDQLGMTDKELDRIPGELQTFWDYLMHFKADRGLAMTVLESADRSTMISISESSVDTVVKALAQGDMKFFMDQLPDNDSYKGNTLELNKVEDYRLVLKSILDRTDQNTGAVTITRDELRTIFNYVCGSMPASPNKFTSLLKHHRLHVGDVWLNDNGVAKTVRGIKAIFGVTNWKAYLKPFASVTKPLPTKTRPKLVAV